MEVALRGREYIDENFLSEWVTLLGHPLIHPRCETLFEIMKNVCLAMFEKPVKWDEIDLLKIFLKSNFISESCEIQRAIYERLEKFVDAKWKFWYAIFKMYILIQINRKLYNWK